MPEDETFRKNWRGTIHSSASYSVRVGRAGISYQDALGSLRISSEAMSSPWNEIVVYTRSIPDTPERPRAEVLQRLRRALASAGFDLTSEDA
jgi:hypothetical protein